MADDKFVLSADHEVVSALLFYTGIIIIKLLLMSPITILYRAATNTFMNMEDAKFPIIGEKDEEKAKKCLGPNEAVNRVKRAHINDIESIVPFVLLSVLYVFTGPDAAMAIFLFKAFTYARIAHTVVYLLAIPQPSRFLAFLVGFGVNMYMAVQIVRSVY